MAETLEALAMIVAARRAMGLAADHQPRWWIHQIVLDDLVVGDVGFHGPPATPTAEGRGTVDVEIGYNVVPDLRGRGIATRAVGLLVAWAWRHGATVVRAETDAANVASGRVLRRAGFLPLGDDQYALTRPDRP